MPSCSYITEWVIVRSAPGRAAAAPPISRCWSDAAPVAVPARLPANARPPLTGKHISNQLNPPAAALMRLSRAAVQDRSVQTYCLSWRESICLCEVRLRSYIIFVRATQGRSLYVNKRQTYSRTAVEKAHIYTEINPVSSWGKSVARYTSENGKLIKNKYALFKNKIICVGLHPGITLIQL